MSLRHLLVLLAAAAMLAWAAEEPEDPLERAINDQPGALGGVSPGTEPGGPDHVTGWLVGANCWLGNGVRGAENRECAVSSAEMGTPLVILTDDGSIIYPIGITDTADSRPEIRRLLPYAEQRVALSGRIVSKGRARAMIIDSIAPAPEPKSAKPFASSESANVRIKGRVTALAYWLGQSGTAPDHNAANTKACVTAGDPIVIVDNAGFVYYPVTKTMPSGPAGNPLLVRYCEQNVEVTGTVINRGKVRSIIVENVRPETTTKPR